jgi:cysteinyl-tRNA synthetase
VLRLHDTALGRVVDIEPRTPGELTMYACGPTVYGPPHLGHGRQTLTYDILRRYLEWAGWRVRHVSNITDVDDNIIERANREGRSSEEVAAEFEALHYRAMDALGVLRPHVDPHASAYVDRMVELVAELADKGLAYETSDGVYMEVEKVEDYGVLALQPLENLRAGARVDVEDEKRSPLDFALWKKSKPGEPAWESPWGPGRPGWHTECVVMSLDILGEGFDLHTGGQDLRFPHHENERAQAVALGKDFARHWMHHGFVEIEGEKMSKSLGNYVNLIDLVDSTDPRAYRLLVLRSHYRSPIEITRETIADAVAALGRLDSLARRTADLAPAPPAPDVLDRFRERMEDDLDTPAAMALLFETVRQANSALDIEDEDGAGPLAAAVREIAAVVGLALRGEAEAPAEVQDLARRREEARARKDFAAADRLRDELASRSWVVEDTASGPKLRPS